MALLRGATDPPSPVISEVMPWKIFDGRRGSTRMGNSDWPSMSMKPGATTLPAASMVRLRGAAERLPMAEILPSRMPRSPEYHGDPVPSMMWPLVMTRSKVGAWADNLTATISNKNAGNIADILLEVNFLIILLSLRVSGRGRPLYRRRDGGAMLRS